MASKDRKRIVVKIEISTLSDAENNLDMKKMERLAMILTNLMNSGVEVLLVSSGAIALGAAKMGMKKMPGTLTEKQAVAAIGQAELIKFYQNFFNSYNQVVAQVLLTNDVIENPEKKKNAKNTFENLLDMNIIPIINENDTVSTEDIEMDDNYPLVINVATLVNASMILIKSKKEGYPNIRITL